MATWTIKGETGKRLNATVRTFDSLGVQGPRLKFVRGGDDEFSFTLPITTTAGAGIDGVNRIPEAGQVVEVFRNDVRKFKGEAMFPELSMSAATVRVLGPNHWMRRLPVMSNTGMTVDTDTDADGTRPVVVFPQQALKESLRVLINAAGAAGVPIQNIGTGEVDDFISTMFLIPKLTISGKSWADALGELLKWCLDAVPWYDYTSATAKLKITRRGAMDPLVLTVGGGILDDGFRIRPVLELEAGEVSVEYMTRNPTTGRPRVARQKYGSSATKKQLVVVSGTDVQDLSLPEEFDSYQIQTTDSYSTVVNTTESSLVAARETYGSQVAISVSNGGTLTYWRGWETTAGGTGSPMTSLGKQSLKLPSVAFVTSAGDSLSLTGRHFVLTGPEPDWLRGWRNPDDEPIILREGTLSGMMTKTFLQNQNDEGNFDTLSVPEWVTGLGMTKIFSGYTDSQRATVYGKTFTLQCRVVSIDYSTKTTLYPPWQWDFLKPPANLAENLHGCSNWVQWEGTIPVYDEDVSGDNVLASKIQVANWLPECETMNALLKSVEYDFDGKKVIYTLGGSPAVDYRSLIGRTMSQRIDRTVLL